MTKFSVRIQGNGHEFNVFQNAKTAEEAVAKVAAVVAVSKKHKKVRGNDLKIFTM